ncbi:PIR protein [Plasmodium ovale]|uniref:PIR protein n=1 Tax=Plasmodium ovale TaxID=36330 RepID=A0A1D3JFI0_PLAOA|nr:PIR protein [Plasmodium ovale]
MFNVSADCISIDVKKKYNVVTSYKEYKKEISKYNSEDSIINFPGCASVKYENINISDDDFPKLCSTAIQFLSHLKVNSDNYKEDGCKYLLYSLYVDVLKRNTTIDKSLILFQNLNNLFNDDYNGENTLDKYINNLSINSSNNLIKLIDMYVQFDKFQIEFKSKPQINKCTSDCVQLFKGYLDECRKGNDYDFCYELKNFREQYNEFIENVIICEDQKYLLPPVEMIDAKGMIIIPSVITIITAFIIPILYKFTAFGPWIRRSIGIRNNIFENINEETNNQIYTSEMVNKNSERRNYNVVYSSS